MTGIIEVRARHAAHSVLRERIVEHVFVGEAMRRLWQRGILDIEILRAEFDTTGYDLVMCCGSVMRHVQFKVSLVDGARTGVTINQHLARAPSGCVIWLGVAEDLVIKEYRWFGGAAGQPLPDLSGYPTARHTRGNWTCPCMTGHAVTLRLENLPVGETRAASSISGRCADATRCSDRTQWPGSVAPFGRRAWASTKRNRVSSF